MSDQTRARFHLVCVVAHMVIAVIGAAGGWGIVALANAIAAVLHQTVWLAIRDQGATR